MTTTQAERAVINWRLGGSCGGEKPSVGIRCLFVFSLGKPYTQDFDCVLAKIGKSGAIYLDNQDYGSAFVKWENVNRWVPCSELIANKMEAKELTQ